MISDCRLLKVEVRAITEQLDFLTERRKVPDATCDEVEVALNMKHQTCSARSDGTAGDAVGVHGAGLGAGSET